MIGDLGSSSDITRDYSNDYFFGAPNTTYITTDPISEFPLEVGKRYFADFDISQISLEARLVIPYDSIKYHLKYELSKLGHELSDIKIEMVTPEIQRISFTVNNPPMVFWVILAIGAAIGLAYGVSSAGAGFEALFIGLGTIPIALAAIPQSMGEAIEKIAAIPEHVVKDAIKNPVAVIAIVIVIGIFIIGVR